MFPERLAEGYRAFLRSRFIAERSRYEMLAETGQKPEIMVIGCVDSRVSPEVIFDAAPGELLVVRNVANLAPRYEPDRASQHGTSAALEFGVQALGVKHIVVMGHATCGGIRALADKRIVEQTDFVGHWVQQLAPAVQAAGPRGTLREDEYLRRLELAAVQLSLKNLMTFPWLRERVEAGTLALHGTYFGIAEGRLLLLNGATARFEPVTERVDGDRVASLRLPLGES